MEKRPADMKGICKFIEKAVADSRQRVVLLLRDWAMC